MLLPSSLLAWAVGLFASVLGRNIHSFAGPFIGYMIRADVCPSDGTFVTHMKTSHFNPARPYDPQYVWGNISLKRPWDDSLWANINLAVRANNEWKQNAFIFDFPNDACTKLRDNTPLLLSLVDLTLSKKGPCVIRAKQYYIRNHTINWSLISPKLKVMPYGHHLGTITAGDVGQRTRKYCLLWEIKIIPKSK